MPDQSEPNVNALQMAAQLQNWTQEAADYILLCNKFCEDKQDLWNKPSNNLIEGAEMIKAFNG